MKQEQNFERELPSAYRQAKYINAKNAKVGLLFNLIALLVFALVLVLAVLLLQAKSDFSFVEDVLLNDYYFLALLVFCIVMVAYVVLYEVVHGIAYKALTGEKLTFDLFSDLYSSPSDFGYSSLNDDWAKMNPKGSFSWSIIDVTGYTIATGTADVL